MLVNTKGLVLRSVHYSETSIIVTIYTEALGVRSYLVKGVRKQSKQSKTNIFQPLQVLDLVVSEQENKKLQFIKEYKIDFLFQSLRFDIRKTAIGLFIIELVNNSVREMEANAQLFQYILGSLNSLDEQVDSFQCAHLQFMLQLTNHLGFFPLHNFSESNAIFALQEGQFVSQEDGYFNCLSEEDSLILHQYLKQQTGITRNQRSRLLEIFEKYYSFHVPNYINLKTPEVFSEVFH